MAKKSSRNNDFLNSNKDRTSPKVYSLLLELVNEDREDLAREVVKIDYLLEYSSTCVKQRDFDQAKETLNNAETRINDLKKQGVDTEHLEYLHEGIAKKCKLKI